MVIIEGGDVRTFSAWIGEVEPSDDTGIGSDDCCNRFDTYRTRKTAASLTANCKRVHISEAVIAPAGAPTSPPE